MLLVNVSNSFESSNRQQKKPIADDPLPQSADVADVKLQFALEHSIGSQPFRVRSLVEMSLTQSSPRSVGSITISDATLNEDELEVIKLASKNNQFYRIRLVPQGGLLTRPAAMASVPVCSLVASNFVEELGVESDMYGNVIALDYSTPVADCTQADVSRSTVASFRPRARLLMGKPGEKPKNIRVNVGTRLSTRPIEEGEPPPPPPQPEESEKKPPPEEEKSFFQKYWLYILMFVVYMMLQSGGAGQPADRRGAGNPAATSPSSGAAASGPQKRPGS